MTMVLIETKTLGADATSIEFTSIPQDATDLVALLSLRSTTSNTSALVSFNASTTGFTFRYMLGVGDSTLAGTVDRYIGTMPTNLFTANTFSNTLAYIPNYSGSTNKSYSLDDVTENNATSSYQIIGAGLWANTAAITSMSISVSTGNIATGSTISLYKITKGSSGGVVVS
jgi:hypothetical protein